MTQKEDGTITQNSIYEPFGKQIPLMDGANSRLGFISKEKDIETSLGDFGVRKYDEEIGRFTSIDPLWEKYLGYTPYHYCGNNPISYIDRNGKGFNTPGAKIINNSDQPIVLTGCSGLEPDKGEVNVPDITLNPGDSFVPTGIGVGHSFGGFGIGLASGYIVRKDGSVEHTEANDIDGIRVQDGQKFWDDNSGVVRGKDEIEIKDMDKGVIKISGTIMGKFSPSASSTITISNAEYPFNSNILVIDVYAPLEINKVTSPEITF